MAWSAPVIHAVGDILTASDWNITSNDLVFLGAASGNSVTANQSTSSTSYGDLLTVGPVVTLTTGANALVIMACAASSSGAGTGAAMGCAVSGATTIAAPAAAGAFIVFGTNIVQGAGFAFVTGLTPGSNTFTAKYAADGGGTASFLDRSIFALPLP